MRFDRRQLLHLSAAGALGCSRFSDRRPLLVGGVASGDVTADRAIVWSMTDRPARMLVEWSTTDTFVSATRAVGPDASESSGYTAQLDLGGLPPDTRVYYRVTFQSLTDSKLSEPSVGSFRTAPPAGVARDVRIAWSGDVAGQGWGIDPARGGMPVFDALAREAPDVFIHCGDTVYADVPLADEIPLPDGSRWKNLVTDGKRRRAETLADYRGNHAYNFLDGARRRFGAAVPVITQWDDHEVRNDWYPGERLRDLKILERDVDVLAGHGRRAFFEHTPTRRSADDPDRVYRALGFGALAEVFVIDERSFRGPRTDNRQKTLDRASQFLGRAQLEWLKQSLAASGALWKIIASDMPMSCNIGDPKRGYEGWANAEPGGPLGRELELASLLSFIQENKVRNVLFVTADVHFPANIHYHPDRASAFKQFDPFWEFISGPLHAAAFGPSALDSTFGPQYRWHGAPSVQAVGPGHGFAAYGVLRIDAKSRSLTVTQHGIDGKLLATQRIEPT